MIDHQQLVEEIKSSVSSVYALDADSLSDVAAMYLEACDDINRRLRECYQLLAKGHRSEAIQRCDEEKLLDEVALLDFPEQEAWISLLTERGMVLPPPLRLDLATELNEAYADHASLGSLLKKHRLLALTRSPLATRLQVLRWIAKSDAKNPVWGEDLELFERARLNEISQQLDAAVKRADLNALKAMEAELQSSDWSSAPAPALVDKAKKLRVEVTAKWARAELGKLVAKLDEAYAAFDVDTGRNIRARWLELVPLAQLNSSDELATQSAPALEWLADQDTRESDKKAWLESCSTLERAIEDKASDHDLHRLHHAVLRWELGIPDLLEARYNQRIKSMEVASGRKFRLIVGATAGVMILVAVLVGWVIMDRTHRKRVSVAVETIRTTVPPDAHERGRSYLDGLQRDDPRVFASAEVKQAIVEFYQAVAKEKERRELFAKSLEAAKSAGVDEPDRNAIREAEGTARTPQEKAAIEEFNAAVAERQRTILSDIDNKFVAELDKIRKRLSVIAEQSDTNSGEQMKQIQSIKVDINSLVSRSPRVTSGVSDQAKPVLERADELVSRMRGLESQATACGRITAAVGRADAFKAALESFAKEFPKEPASAEFTKVVRESAAWDAIIGWSSFLGSSDFESLRTIEPSKAKSLLAQGQELAGKSGDNPLAAEFHRREDLLKAVAARDGDGKQPLHEQIIKLLRDPLTSQVWLVVTEDGDRYYTMARPVEDVDRITIDYVEGYDLTPKSRKMFLKDVKSSERAPQCKIAETAIDQLRTITGANWEKTMFDLYRSLLSDQQTDPILRSILAKRVLETACQGSHCFSVAFKSQLEQLTSPAFDDSIAWMKPADEAVARERAKASQMLEGLLREATAAGTKAGDLLKQLSQPPASTYRWVGWLHRDAKGNWECLGSAGDAAGSLEVVVPGVASGPCEIKEIGRLERGSVTWKSPTDERYLQGRPLLLKVVRKP